LPHLNIAYTISAVVGIGITVVVMMLIGKILTKKNN